MATPQTTRLSPPGPSPLPILEPGDHLTREEFERRYDAMPQVKKAELIEGVVYMPSPVRFDQHGGQHADLIWWLTHYRVFTPGVRVGDNSTVRLDLDTEPQPDALMLVEPRHGGRVQISPDGSIEGAPELVGEVAASTASLDLHTKLRVYHRNHVREYVVWRVLDNAIDWLIAREGRYEPLLPGDDGIYRSEVLPGLWLDAAALLRGDLATVVQTVQQGVTSAEHAAFVERLQQEKLGASS